MSNDTGPQYGYLPDYVIEKVANFPSDRDCPWCAHKAAWENNDHAPNCPVTVARDLLKNQEPDDDD